MSFPIVLPMLLLHINVVDGCLGREIRLLEQWVQGDLQPDLTLLFDVPVEVSAQRLAKARSPDKFERESSDFFKRIREAYLLRAEEAPQRFKIIDGNQPLDNIKQLLDKIILSL